jgi:uncharacterized protein (DUF3084 family)
MTTEEELDRLTNIVDSLASSVVHHDNQIELLASGMVERDAQIAAHDRQIEGLIQIVEKQSEQISKSERAVASLERQWQAYNTTLPVTLPTPLTALGWGRYTLRPLRQTFAPAPDSF